MSAGSTRKRALGVVAGERGFTLIEVMFAIVLMTVGLLAVADVFPRGLALSLYGKDQTKAAGLAQQQIEFLKTQATSGSCPSTPIAQTATASLNCLVGDYAVNVSSAYFDQNASTVTQSGSYFVRDVQIQYWTWNATSAQFTLPGNPYTPPGVSTYYVYRVSVATHWRARGQTTFTSGNSNSPNGCVSGGVAVPTGLGCVQVSTFITP